jgi:hypothetical protein
MTPHTNANEGPQGTSYRMPHYSDRVPSGTEQQSSPPPGTRPANPETLGNSQPRKNIYTSPTRSSDSDTSDKSDKSDNSEKSRKSRKSRRSRGDDRLSDILSTLTLQNIGMSESEMFSGDVSDFLQFLNRYEGLMKNVTDPQVKLTTCLYVLRGRHTSQLSTVIWCSMEIMSAPLKRQ